MQSRRALLRPGRPCPKLSWQTGASGISIRKRILDFQKNVLVGGRHLAIPLEKYNELKGFGDFNNAWLDAAVPMASKAVSGLLEGSGLVAEDISAITSTTVTGLAVPSLDARLMNKLPFKRNTKRLPFLDWVVWRALPGST